MGHGPIISRQTKKRADETVAAPLGVRAPGKSAAATRASKTSRTAVISEVRKASQPVLSSTQVEMETKVSSQHPSSGRQQGSNSKSARRSSSHNQGPPPQKAIMTERMIAQFTKETCVGREEDKRNREQAVFDWCNQLQLPVPHSQDALFRHDVSMAALRQMKTQGDARP